MEITNQDSMHIRILKDMPQQIQILENMPVFCSIVTKGFHKPCKLTILYEEPG